MLDVQLDPVAALINVLDAMAFIAAQPAPNDAKFSPESVVVRIGFGGTARGVLELAADWRFGAMVAENLLGPPDAGTDIYKRAFDAMRELMNVTCGVMLADSPDAAHLKPEMCIPECVEVEAAENWDGALLEADGHVISVRLTEGNQ